MDTFRHTMLIMTMRHQLVKDVKSECKERLESQWMTIMKQVIILKSKMMTSLTLRFRTRVWTTYQEITMQILKRFKTLEILKQYKKKFFKRTFRFMTWHVLMQERRTHQSQFRTRVKIVTSLHRHRKMTWTATKHVWTLMKFFT